MVLIEMALTEKYGETCPLSGKKEVGCTTGRE